MLGVGTSAQDGVILSEKLLKSQIWDSIRHLVSFEDLVTLCWNLILVRTRTFSFIRFHKIKSHTCTRSQQHYIIAAQGTLSVSSNNKIINDFTGKYTWLPGKFLDFFTSCAQNTSRPFRYQKYLHTVHKTLYFSDQFSRQNKQGPLKPVVLLAL